MGGWNVKVGDLAGAAPDVLVAGSVEAEREASIDPVWAAGDTAIVYVRYYAAGPKIEVVDLRSGSARSLFAAPSDVRHLRLTDWSSNGRRVAFEWARRDSGGTQAWEYDITSDSLRRMFDSPADVSEMRYAPSGGWIAYQSTTAGESDILLRPYPGPGPPVRVSSGGGRLPRWRADSGELYYIAPDGAIVAVPVRLGTSAVLGTPQAVVSSTTLGGRRAREFDAEPSGRRFQMLIPEEISELTLVLNWWALLNRAR